MPSISTGSVRGWRSLILANDALRVTALPEKGADIYELTDLGTGMDVLFKGEWGLQPPGSPPLEGSGDDQIMWNYEGGWQELLPSVNEACTYRGRPIPFHGEVATLPWEYELADDAMLPPDELRGLVRLVHDGSFEHELGPAQAHHPLEPERRLPAARPQPLGVLAELVLPGKRRHLAVKRDRTAPVPAFFVDAREKLLPAPLVVPHELVVAAPLQRRRARRLEPPFALEENVHSRAQVGEFVDVGAFLGQGRHPQHVVREDQAPPAADRACRDARHPPRGSSPGCTSLPSARNRRSGRCR
jgi:hypothetical protein